MSGTGLQQSPGLHLFPISCRAHGVLRAGAGPGLTASSLGTGREAARQEGEGGQGSLEDALNMDNIIERMNRRGISTSSIQVSPSLLPPTCITSNRPPGPWPGHHLQQMVNTVHFTVHTTYFTLHTAHCTLHTLHTEHCTPHTANFPLQTAHML